jgi:transcriptional regulator with XRE-family HTH domain
MSLSELLRDLDNKEYRRGFVEGHAKDTVAFQIRQLRKAENWEQRDLAEKAFGNPALQPMVSRYENPDYGKYSLSTLLELAAAFDVALILRFAPFSELLEWDINSKESTLRPAKYSQDAALRRFAAACEQAEDFKVNMFKPPDKPGLGSLNLNDDNQQQTRDDQQKRESVA